MTEQTKILIELGKIGTELGYLRSDITEIKEKQKSNVTQSEFVTFVNKVEALHVRVDCVDTTVKNLKAKYTIPFRIVDVVVTATIVGVVSYFFTKIV